ncbi:frequency clock protein [Plectosphaerella plurivora]|uniref:Frequency clock protein n=1 Tax=Plectosphaerella plurivora TaxID=936078 RepID=A0A9P8V9P2_9PEZI|nr:frequency clock protein [Plectosphaerella plurivora]
MTDLENKHTGTGPPLQSPNAAGQPMPRRTSAQKSVTLQHHRLTRDATMKAQSPSKLQQQQRQPTSVPRISVSHEPASSPRRNSSGDSHETAQSDPRTWFDQSNENPTAAYSQAMDIDPPFYQKETDSSNEEMPQATYPFHLRPGAANSLKPTVTRSSSTDDYRSVIDDLTVEIQRLKEELKKYKQNGPEMMKKEKLFEIKVHGLPKRKKRELEATLRDFASGLSETPSQEASSARKKSSRHVNRLYSASGSMSKHASSSSGSNSRPVDSAYASASTGPNSSGTSLNRPSMSNRARSSEQKVENYLKDIPEGLYPRHMVMTEKDKKKLVVRRLEQLFTGKITGRTLNSHQRGPRQTSTGLAPVIAEATAGQPAMMHQPPNLRQVEPCREARILGPDESASGKKSRSRDNASTENSNGDQTESGGNGAAVGDANVSPPNANLPEQRPTRPLDLDPDRAQVPSENMDYIRHLGLVPPELLPDAKSPDVAPDAEGWVYLNLLCNLAQLHMVNVTPDFIRTAVSEKSTKFQMSPDGRKIRWRGGSEGTKFSSESSGNDSQRSPSSDNTDGSNEDGGRKKQRTTLVQPGSGDDFTSGLSSKNASKFGFQGSGPSDSFHYKPLFVHQSSSIEQTSMDETVSSLGPADESNIGESRWDNSGSGSSQRRKRRLDGAIIYYNGAPFCTDLSGDPGDVSPATYMASSGNDAQQQSSDRSSAEFVRPPPPQRSASGSFLRLRPLSDGRSTLDADPELCLPGLTTDDSDESDIEADFPWSGTRQVFHPCALEPSGLGGVFPEDHFVVMVSTKRPKYIDTSDQTDKPNDGEATDAIIKRLAMMSTSSPHIIPVPKARDAAALPVKIEYVAGRIKRLAPVPLPPPATFFPPFSSESDSSGSESFGSEADDEGFTEQFVSRRTDSRRFDNHYPDDEDMTSADEEGEEPDDADEPESSSASPQKGIEIALPPRDAMRRTSSSAIAAAGTVRGRSKSLSAELPQSGTSNATLGDAESGYSSGE